MDNLKKVLILLFIFKKKVYQCRRPIVVIIDTSLIAIRWTIKQDNQEGIKFVIRFEAKILMNRQKAYFQIKYEFWRALTTLKSKKNYFIGTNVALETIFLLLLGLVSNYFTLNIAMLR